MSLSRHVRRAALSAALALPPTVVVAVPQIGMRRRASQKQTRPGSTKYWRNLILLSGVTSEHPPGGGDVQYNFDSQRLPTLRGRNHTRLRWFNNRPNSTYALVRYPVPAVGRDVVSQSCVISDNVNPWHNSWNITGGGANGLITRYGITAVHAFYSDVGAHIEAIIADGSWNQANGFFYNLAPDGSATMNIQNGTAGRGFGDVATTSTGSVTQGASSQLYVGFMQIGRGPNCHFTVANNIWSATGQKWFDEETITGSYGEAALANALSQQFNGQNKTALLAIWKGNPFSYREFLRDIANRKDPSEIFRG